MVVVVGGGGAAAAVAVAVAVAAAVVAVVSTCSSGSPRQFVTSSGEVQLVINGMKNYDSSGRWVY